MGIVMSNPGVLKKKIQEWMKLYEETESLQKRDVLQDKLTSEKGVSETGIEARRADPKKKGILSHGYARVSTPEKHGERAKAYAREDLKDLKAQPKPNLPKSEKDPVKNYDKMGPKALSDDKKRDLHAKIKAYVDKKTKLGKSENGHLGPHIIFSPEKPLYPNAVKVKESTQEAVQNLVNQGEDAKAVQGHYGQPENSVIVFNPKNPQAILQHAKDLGQESAIHSDGENHKFIFLNGPDEGHSVSGKGTVFHTEKPKDNYTTLPNGQHFTHNFDFSKKGKI